MTVPSTVNAARPSSADGMNQWNYSSKCAAARTGGPILPVPDQNGPAHQWCAGPFCMSPVRATLVPGTGVSHLGPLFVVIPYHVVVDVVALLAQPLIDAEDAVLAVSLALVG